MRRDGAHARRLAAAPRLPRAAPPRTLRQNRWQLPANRQLLVRAPAAPRGGRRQPMPLAGCCPCRGLATASADDELSSGAGPDTPATRVSSLSPEQGVLRCLLGQLNHLTRGVCCRG